MTATDDRPVEGALQDEPSGVSESTCRESAGHGSLGSVSIANVAYCVDPIFVEMTGGTLAVSSPHTSFRMCVQQPVLDLLRQSEAGLCLDDLEATTRTTADRLLELGFLRVGPSPQAPAPWDAWGSVAWWFHQRTRDTAFVPKSEEASMIASTDLGPMPRTTKDFVAQGKPIVLLPRVRTPMNQPFSDVLEQRRTHRTFLDAPCDLDRLATALHYSFAPLRFGDAGPLGVLQLRAAASGGARHETEAYVGIFNVSDLEPGLYHYDNIRHGLVLVDRDVGRDQFEHFTHEQQLFRNAAFGVLMVAVTGRMAWKYRNPRAYKLLFHNTGHAAQVFSMVASALGLGASLTGALRDTDVDSALHLEGPSEFTTFAMGCGIPVLQENGMPDRVLAAKRPTEAK
jgi:SagB-type dehydrogenase family enzyme